MRKIFPLCLLLLALTLTANAALAEPPAAPAPAPAIAAPLALFSTATGSCPTATVMAPVPSPAALDLFGALSCCRPECSVNSDCDRKCGKGLGSCVQVNSCCKQCICSAT
jgi:hypothetical protein